MRRIPTLLGPRALRGGAGAAFAVPLVSSAPAGTAAPAARDTAPGPLRVVARGLAGALYVTAPANERNRLYVVQRTGLVRVLVEAGSSRARSSTSAAASRVGSERGLLSIAFLPRFATDRLLYACYTDHAGAIDVVELRKAGGRVDVASARMLLHVPHDDSGFHNGGQLAFGPDAKLYAGIGDGGYAGGEPDPHGNSQNLDVLLGKIVRVDPAATEPLPEIVAYGLRNRGGSRSTRRPSISLSPTSAGSAPRRWTSCPPARPGSSTSGGAPTKARSRGSAASRSS
jgi:glucose/arabinose dehydrogenase